MKNTIYSFLLFLMLAGLNIIQAQVISVEKDLGRGLVAYRTLENSKSYVVISWRYLAKDQETIKFNVYKDGTKINTSPITEACWFRYQESSTSEIVYTLTEIIDETESSPVATYTLKTSTASKTPYIEIPMKQIEGDTNWEYSPNDASVGDLDGDGEYEIIIHRTGVGQDNSNSGITSPPVLQAYKLDGTFLWEINLGKNIREGAHYTQFMVYDLDGDGKSEIVCKTAEGSKDSKGKNVGEDYFPEYTAKYGFSRSYNPNADYRNSSGYILSGPEFLTVFSGETGEEVFTTEYDPPRLSTYNNGDEIPYLSENKSNLKTRWGDDYGNRCDRFLACVAYLDGADKNPSVVMCRGYYTRTVLVAYDFKNGKLEKRWKFDTWKDNKFYAAYEGQGNHSLSVADVDQDGFDEIIYGACTIDHNGTGLYTTRLGHGDALHTTDLNPDRPGLEVFSPHENKVDGTTLRDAKTGAILWQVKSSDDVGRGMTADIDPNHRGLEMWSSRSGGVISSSSFTTVKTSTSGISMNMACWWDGDLLRELQDGTSITKYDYKTKTTNVLLTANGCSSNNSTKSNPCLQADVLGDWREEVILRTSDNKSIRIYMTPYETDYRFHSFMQDKTYRMSVVFQNVAYNQPTQPGFYFGPDWENIFMEDSVELESNEYTLRAFEGGNSYLWEDGSVSQSRLLKKGEWEGYKKFKVDVNFRGYIFSDSIVIKFGEATKPLPGINPSPNNKSTLETFKSITLSWENKSNTLGGELTYDIYLGKSAETLEILASDLNEKKYTINADLEKNTTYYWKVVSKNSLGETDSNIWSFTTSGDREMILHFDFDETEGSVAVDNIAGLIATPANTSISWGKGIIDNAINISPDNTSSHMNIPHVSSLLLNKESFTISLWFKSLGEAPDTYLLHKGTHAKNVNTGATGKWFGIQYKNGNITWGIDDDITKTTVDISASNMFDNKWHHITCIRDILNKKLIVYLDGRLAKEVTDNTTNIGEASPLILGNRNTNFDNPYTGSFDDLRIYKSALTASEVYDIYKEATIQTGIETINKNTSFKAFINDQVLFIESEEAETIEIYSIHGIKIFSQSKDAGYSEFRINNIGKGIFIIRGSSGWSKKEIVF